MHGGGERSPAYVAIVLQRSRLVLSRVPHLHRVFEDSDELFDLPVVQYSGRNPPFGGEPLQQVDPFCPLSVFRALDLIETVSMCCS